MYKCLVMSMTLAAMLVIAAEPVAAQSSESGAVREYEAYRRWKDQGHRGDYQDYLDYRARHRHGDADGSHAGGPSPSTSKAVRKNIGRDRHDRAPDDGAWNEPDRHPDRVGRGGRRIIRKHPRRDPTVQLVRPVGHQHCANHYDRIDEFDGFPCRVVRPCKQCGELVTLHARAYEYDRRGALDKIRYSETICPQCGTKVKLKVSFSD